MTILMTGGDSIENAGTIVKLLRPLGGWAMLIGPSDMYGDLSAEDVEEFEGLQPENGREVDPEGRFQRDEVRSFERDFEFELDNPVEDEYWDEVEEGDDEDLDWLKD